MPAFLQFFFIKISAGGKILKRTAFVHDVEGGFKNFSADRDGAAGTETALFDDNGDADAGIIERRVADEPAVVATLRIFGGTSFTGDFVRETCEISRGSAGDCNFVERVLHELDNVRVNLQFADEFRVNPA